MPKPDGAVVAPAVVDPVVPGADVKVSDGAVAVVAPVEGAGTEDAGAEDAAAAKRLPAGAAGAVPVAAAGAKSDGGWDDATGADGVVAELATKRLLGFAPAGPSPKRPGFLRAGCSAGFENNEGGAADGADDVTGAGAAELAPKMLDEVGVPEVGFKIPPLDEPAGGNKDGFWP